MKLSKQMLRLILLGVTVFAVFAVFLFRLSQLQIVMGADFLEEQNKGSSRTQVIKAARGEIVDRNGSPFAYNQRCYNIQLDRALSPAENDNDTILWLVKLMRKTEEPWIDNLPINVSGSVISFADDEEGISRLRTFLNTNIYTSAEDLFYWLKERYGLDNMNNQDARAVAGVRYEMERRGYSLSNRYTFAENISLETAILIRQTDSAVPGINVVEIAQREYVDGDLAPHIIGRVGAIFAEELESYLSQNKGYTREDFVGKEGIEKAFESVLRGTDGIRRIDLDSIYNVTDIFEQQPAIPGNTISLTLDKSLQKVSLDALVKEIEWLQKNAKEGEGKEANAGAVAVIDIKNSELLAAVTYPTYNLETYSADYAENASNPLYPFLNRAFSGIYAPGSCFKPVVATAGLSEGLITPSTRINCGHVYTFFPSYQPTCLGTHGMYNVSDALRASCNIFFYDTGRQLGIEQINQYAKSLGLGVPTGIELAEASGTQCDPESINPGDALQAAIGQLDNGYTPVQLANYAATIARKGVRTKLSLVKSITTYDNRQIVESHTPEVLETINSDDAVFDAIFSGMIQATHSPAGTAYSYLGDYHVTVASKTGTPQTSEFPNSTFICFAPADDPQIAIAVVIEKGWHGYTGAPVARAILDAYFFPEALEDSAEGEQADGLISQVSGAVVSSEA